MKKTLAFAISVGFCSFIVAGDSRSAANNIMRSTAQFHVDHQQRMMQHSAVPVGLLQAQRDMQASNTSNFQQQSAMHNIQQHNANCAMGKRN